MRAYGATNVAVTGRGTIAPRMAVWRSWFEREQRPDVLENMRRLYEWGESDTPVEERRFEDLVAARLRPCCVEFERCRNVRLEGFRIRESPLWCVHLRLCEDVTVLSSIRLSAAQALSTKSPKNLSSLNRPWLAAAERKPLMPR